MAGECRESCLQNKHGFCSQWAKFMQIKVVLRHTGARSILCSGFNPCGIDEPEREKDRCALLAAGCLCWALIS